MAWAAGKFAQPSARKVGRPGEGEAGGYVLVIPVPIWFAAIGLTVSDAFRMLMVRVAAEKALPFEPIVPNKKTVKAIEAAQRGELTTVGRPQNLVHRLNADD